MVIRSPLSDLEIPDVALTPFVLERAAEYGEHAALVDGSSGRTITYAQLDELVRRCAVGLIERGLRPGEVVAIFSPNVPEYAVAFHGVSLAGGASTTVNALYIADELAFQLRDAGARFLVTAPGLLECALTAAAQAAVDEVFLSLIHI